MKTGNFPSGGRKRRKGQAGFTFAELIIAALLITGVMAAVYGSFMTANRWLLPQTNVAFQVARSTMEGLHEAVRMDWWSAASQPLTLGGPYADGNVTLDGVVYTRTYTVLAVAGRDYRRVQVDVTW